MSYAIYTLTATRAGFREAIHVLSGYYSRLFVVSRSDKGAFVHSLAKRASVVLLRVEMN